jgi:hypothetical protein
MPFNEIDRKTSILLVKHFVIFGLLLLCLLIQNSIPIIIILLGIVLADVLASIFKR